VLPLLLLLAVLLGQVWDQVFWTPWVYGHMLRPFGPQAASIFLSVAGYTHRQRWRSIIDNPPLSLVFPPWVGEEAAVPVAWWWQLECYLK